MTDKIHVVKYSELLHDVSLCNESYSRHVLAKDVFVRFERLQVVLCLPLEAVTPVARTSTFDNIDSAAQNSFSKQVESTTRSSSIRTAKMAILSSPLDYISSTPIVTRVLTASTLFASLLYFFLRWHGEKAYSLPYLTLVPGSSIFYPWTFFTAGLVETNIIQVRSIDCILITRLIVLEAFLHAFICTSLFSIFGAIMGNGRNNQVYCDSDHDSKYHHMRR